MQKNLPEPESTSLARDLFREREFYDLFKFTSIESHIDIIMPILHSNDLFRENLLTIYREIPVSRLIVGDAGCIDSSFSLLSDFPRVEVIDHSHISTLGGSLGDLTARLSTPNFAYLQSDVFIPEGWFKKMHSHLSQADWIGSPMQVVAILDFHLDYRGIRPLAGAQLGKSNLFANLKSYIQDDYVYRQEDFVLEEFVRKNGGKIGIADDTFHFHQIMRRKTKGMQMRIKDLKILLDEEKSELGRVNRTQLFGFVKYCDVKNEEVRKMAKASVFGYFMNEKASNSELIKFAWENNRTWIKALIVWSLDYRIRQTIKLLIPRRLLSR